MPEDLEQKLELITDVKRFCMSDLCMALNDSFTRIEKKREFAYYALCVSPKYNVKSMFLGDELIFKTKIWRDLGAKIFDLLGFDVCTGEINAAVEDLGKSTGKTTQVTKSLLNTTTENMVQAVIHENFHIHLLKNNPKHKMSIYIEEPIADYIAYQGALIYYNDNPIMIDKIKTNKKLIDDHNVWYNWFALKLKAAYRVSPEKGKEVLLEAKTEYENLFEMGSEKINNAYFMVYTMYSKLAKPVEDILQNKDPREYLQKIVSAKRIRSVIELDKVVNS